MKRNVVTLFLSIGIVSSVASSDLTQVRNRIGDVGLFCLSNRWDYLVINDAMNFECLNKTVVYASLADAISNDWREVLGHFSEVATNNLERLFVLGVGKQYGEDFYIDYMDALSDMATNNLITAKELEWAKATTRYDLMSCLYRHYQDPRVITLVNKYKVALPLQTNHWNDILSGVAYTNYLEEAAAGLWQ